MRRWVMWIPVLMMGALLYWTLALSFGGLSLLTFSALHDSDALEPDGASLSARDGYQPITVNLAGAVIAADRARAQADEDVEPDPAPAGAVTVDLVFDREAAQMAAEHGQVGHSQGVCGQGGGREMARDHTVPPDDGREPGKTAF